MMSLAHKYEEFGNQNPFLSESGDQGQQNLENEKLQSFEAGYEAGWEDSDGEQKKTRTDISLVLAKNLQEISLNYEEARRSLIGALHPLFEDILTKFLPKMVNPMIGSQVAEQLSELVRRQSEQSIEIFVSSDDFETLSGILQDQISAPFVLTKQSDQEVGLVYLRVGTEEREINFDRVIDDILTSTNCLFEQEIAHG